MELQPHTLSSFTRGGYDERKSFAKALLKDFQSTGFARLIDHGISAEQVASLFQWNKRFFQLPSDAKKAIENQPGPNPQRGWSRIGAENSYKLYSSEFSPSDDEEENLDCREHFDHGSSRDSEHTNLWPHESEVLGFRDFMESTFEDCAAIADAILEALELGLEIEAGSFTDRVSNTASELRLLHYPPIEIQDIKRGKHSRIWPHFDLGVITLLFQDAQGGLEREDRSRAATFVPVSPGPETELVVNISETLQRWTNGSLMAGLHRVTMPDHMKAMQEGVIPDRYSVAFFCKADRETSVAPLSTFVSASQPSSYVDMSAVEYHRRRLQTAYRQGRGRKVSQDVTRS